MFFYLTTICYCEFLPFFKIFFFIGHSFRNLGQRHVDLNIYHTLALHCCGCKDQNWVSHYTFSINELFMNVLKYVCLRCIVKSKEDSEETEHLCKAFFFFFFFF